MAELKTKVNDASVAEFLDRVADEVKRKDSQAILEMMRQATKAEPKMWGDSIIGFGSYHYLGKSSEGDSPLIAFSPRKQALTLYVLGGGREHAELLGQLGKHSRGKVCLYIKRLRDVSMPVLKLLIEAAFADAQELAQAEARKKTSAAA